MVRIVAPVMSLAALLAGAAALHAKTPRAPKPPSGAALEALSKPPVRTSIASERIYFVMTDRYANGDAANDRGGLTGGSTVTGFDPTDASYFHGGDFRGLTGSCTDTTRGLARLKDLGFTAIWVTPPFGQRTVQGDSAAYHGYWVRDFTSVDPHLGSDADFAAFVDCAHRLRLKVILDVVVNHTADYIALPSRPAYSRAPYRDCRGRTFNPALYVRKAFPCLRAAGMPKLPTLAGTDARAKRPAWLNDVTRYHDRGDISSSCSETCVEQGDLGGLDDLFTEQPAVWRGLALVYAGWIRRYKVDGFRIDNAQHVNDAFFRLWVPRIRAAARAAGVKHFELFGSVPVGDAVELSTFVRRRGLPNVLDFPLQDALMRFASAARGPHRVVARLAADDYFEQAGVAPTPPTFVGNHDLGRAALQIRARSVAPISAADLLQRELLAHDLLYLLRGAPVVYYGDEVGMTGAGGGEPGREDMFPTQVQEWKTEERVGSRPIGNGSSFDQGSHPIAQRLRVLGKLRDQVPALSTGASFVRFAQGGVLAVSRIDAAARREYLAVFNSSTNPARLQVPTSTPSSGWTALLGSVVATSDSRGGVSLTVPAVSSLLLRADSQLPARSVTAPKVRIARDELTDLWEVSARAGASGPVSVSFAVRRASGERWLRFGVDDSPPYRGFLNAAGYRRKERVYVVAIARALDGKTAVSRVIPFRPRPR
jgi:alpha-amylase